MGGEIESGRERAGKGERAGEKRMGKVKLKTVREREGGREREIDKYICLACFDMFGRI